ncbi:2-oxoacid:acceptor oxidoreductase family protein [Cryptobacterium curtum]
MLNVLITGIGGQGSVLAAKILAQAAAHRGWQVRTAETIGMAQRGGNVMSHVRMGNNGEEVLAPLIAQGSANCVIALEVGEGLRALPFLSPQGLMVCSTAAIPSVAESLASNPYDAQVLQEAVQARAPQVVMVDDDAICRAVGSRKVANVAMLTAALIASQSLEGGLGTAISLDEMERAMEQCVKPRFVELNQNAIRTTQRFQLSKEEE